MSSSDLKEIKKVTMSSIGINVQQEIDKQIETLGLDVSRDTVVDMVRFLLDDCEDDPDRTDKDFNIEVLSEYYQLPLDTNEIDVASEVVSAILNRQGTVQP
jgi:hypothetical protein